MKFKKILSLSVVTSLLLTSGCTLETSREIQADVVDSTEGQEIEGLKDGGYYVKHDSKLYKVSDPNKTFETGNVVNSPDSERIIYFTDKKVDGEYTNEDWDKIPTLYEGDSLIYYYTDVLSETYNFERFEDVGYTIGIYNLNETVSGRYSFELESDYINDSDANKVSVLPTESAIIDKVSQKELRKGNISNYGTIIGLKQDKLYPFEIYAGTVLNKINIKADTTLGTEEDVATASEYAKNMIVLKVNGDLTIDEGTTLTAYTSKNGYGGPKGMTIYCTGTINNNGTVSMTARGAKAVGQDVYLWKNTDNSYEYVPATGGIGSRGQSGNAEAGAAGVKRQTGGGGAGGSGGSRISRNILFWWNWRGRML